MGGIDRLDRLDRLDKLDRQFGTDWHYQVNQAYPAYPALSSSIQLYPTQNLFPVSLL